LQFGDDTDFNPGDVVVLVSTKNVCEESQFLAGGGFCAPGEYNIFDLACTFAGFAFDEFLEVLCWAAVDSAR
jgi:hypothetical protein